MFKKHETNSTVAKSFSKIFKSLLQNSKQCIWWLSCWWNGVPEGGKPERGQDWRRYGPDFTFIQVVAPTETRIQSKGIKSIHRWKQGLFKRQWVHLYSAVTDGHLHGEISVTSVLGSYPRESGEAQRRNSKHGSQSPEQRKAPSKRVSLTDGSRVVQ